MDNPQYALFHAIETYDSLGVAHAIAKGALWDASVDGVRRIATKDQDKPAHITAAKRALFLSLNTHKGANIIRLIPGEILTPTIDQYLDLSSLPYSLEGHHTSQLLEHLLQHWPSNVDWKHWKNSDGQSLLMLFLRVNNHTNIQGLLNLDPERVQLEARDLKGRSPLFYCFLPNQMEILLEHGADIHSRDAQGVTVMEAVCRNWLALETKKPDYRATIADIRPQTTFTNAALLNVLCKSPQRKKQARKKQLTHLFDQLLAIDTIFRNKHPETRRTIEACNAEFKRDLLKRLAQRTKRTDPQKNYSPRF